MKKLLIDDLQNIDHLTTRKLSDAGIHNIMDLIVRGPVDIAESTGMEKYTAEKIVNKARQYLVQSGLLSKKITKIYEVPKHKENIGRSTQKVVKVDEGLWAELDKWLQTEQAKKSGYHSKAQVATETIRKFLIDKKHFSTIDIDDDLDQLMDEMLVKKKNYFAKMNIRNKEELFRVSIAYAFLNKDTFNKTTEDMLTTIHKKYESDMKNDKTRTLLCSLGLDSFDKYWRKMNDNNIRESLNNKDESTLDSKNQ